MDDSTHIFTSSKGHGKIEAKIVFFFEETQGLAIRCSDGRVLNAKLSDFSSADQAYVSEWKKRNQVGSEDGTLSCDNIFKQSPLYGARAPALIAIPLSTTVHMYIQGYERDWSGGVTAFVCFLNILLTVYWTCFKYNREFRTNGGSNIPIPVLIYLLLHFLFFVSVIFDIDS